MRMLFDRQGRKQKFPDLVGAPPPVRFFADSEKTAALRRRGLGWGTLWGKPCATFGKQN